MVKFEKELPYGISNYEELVDDGYEYVDKTMYLEKLENLSEKVKHLLNYVELCR